MTLKEFLRVHRAQSGMSQAAVAKAIGVSKQAVTQWEGGQTRPTFTNLVALCHLYGVDPKEVFDGETELSVVVLEDKQELRMLAGYRARSPAYRAMILEMIENTPPPPRKRGRPKGY